MSGGAHVPGVIEAWSHGTGVVLVTIDGVERRLRCKRAGRINLGPPPGAGWKCMVEVLGADVGRIVSLEETRAPLLLASQGGRRRRS